MERDITHNCGHTERQFVGGFYVADCEREAARLSRRKCPSCSRQAKQAAAAARTQADRDALNGVALPPLAGSPRQVAWAESIRLQQLVALRRLDPGIAAHAASLVEARWWIEQRLADPATIAARIVTRA